jgi:hypothetical protein
MGLSLCGLWQGRGLVGDVRNGQADEYLNVYRCVLTVFVSQRGRTESCSRIITVTSVHSKDLRLAALEVFH